MHRYIIFYLLLLISLTGFSQPAWQKTDSLTWESYRRGEWKSLLREADRSLRNGIDFYYLRVRAGVAAWELKNYRLAADHLIKAHRANGEDDFVTSLLHSSFALAGRTDEAAALADSLPAGVRDTLQIRKSGLVKSVTSESLFSFNGNFASDSKSSFTLPGAYSNYSSQMKNLRYQSLALDLHLSPRFNFFHQVSLLNINREQRYFSEVTGIDTSRATFSRQWQYFAGARLLGGKGWSSWVTLTKLWGEARYHIPGGDISRGFTLTEAAWKINDYLVHVGAARELTWWRPELSLSTGQMNRARQWQANAAITLYPFGNANFYTHTEGSLHAEGESDETRAIIHQRVTVKSGPVWLSGEGRWGTIRNFSTENGLVVYNMPETIKSIYGASLWVPLAGYRLNLTLRYQLSSKEGYNQHYADAYDYTTTKHIFKEQSFLISLQWNL